MSEWFRQFARRVLQRIRLRADVHSVSCQVQDLERASHTHLRDD